MKAKALFTLALALLAGASAFGQGAHLGIKAGIAGNWMPGTNINIDDAPKVNVGFYGGVAGTFDLSETLFLQAEALYTRKGNSTDSPLTGKYSRNVSYVQLPVFFGASVGSDDALKVMVGPEFAYAIGNQVRQDAALNPAGGDKYSPRPFNFGIGAQATYFITDGMGIDIRFDWGLTKTLRKAVETAADDNGHNLSVMLGICYRFGD